MESVYTDGRIEFPILLTLSLPSPSPQPVSLFLVHLPRKQFKATLIRSLTSTAISSLWMWARGGWALLDVISLLLMWTTAGRLGPLRCSSRRQLKVP